jgi:hypothetical protein
MRPSELKEVIRLAKAISVVQPFLEEGKYLEYSWGIFKAAQHYGIEAEVLISITEQETNFREDLPEGAAGERGICQIRKNWLQNKKFRKEFRKATIKDLHRPSKSFLFAAWILRGLKDQVTSNTLPYWSYYNSVRFENRMKYFLAVNKNIVALKRYEGYINAGMAPEEAVAQQVISEPKPTMVASAPVVRPAPTTNYYPVLKAQTVESPTQFARTPSQISNRVAEVKSSNGGTTGRWISDALVKIQKQTRSREVANGGQSEGKKIVPTSIMRTAQELGVSNFYNSASLQD